MKIKIVSLDESLISLGVRRLVAYVRTLNADTTTYYLPLMKYRSPLANLLPKHPNRLNRQDQVHDIAAPLADADIVALSSMTHVAEQTKTIIGEVRRINPRAYIVWGGIHPSIAPDDAIAHADAVCTGEGEFAFAEFLDAFGNGGDYAATPNFWFNRKSEIIRNRHRPLMTSAEMDALPTPAYGSPGEMIYQAGKRRWAPLVRRDYMKFIGLAYNTIWTIGCPFKCTFCANSKFIENDRTYMRLRYPRARWIVDEINAARRVHPHISNVVFHDDSFMALPTGVLAEFAALYRSEVALPFCVMGVIPSYVKADKLEILLEGGLNRVRMGIQSGSQRILDFYERPTPVAKIAEAAGTLAKYSRYMIPPAYDMIFDNPIETREDVVDSLELNYRMPRPFTTNLYALRVQPNTPMDKQFEALGISPPDIGRDTYTRLAPTFANCLLVLMQLVRPPRPLFDRLLRRVQRIGVAQRMYPRVYLLLRLAYLTRRVLSHVRYMDFTLVPGRTGAVLWSLGIVGFWNRRLTRRFRRPVPLGPNEHTSARPLTGSVDLLPSPG